jgi:hypothetical protein
MKKITLILLTITCFLSCSDSTQDESASLPSITTSPITSITETAATSGGTILSDGGANITSKGIVWNTSPNPTIALSTKTIDGSGNNNYTSTLFGLTRGTTYYIRAYAINSLGAVYGNEISFSTPDITTGLIANYKFNGNANDLSGNNYNGAVSSGMTLSNDRFGNVNSSYKYNGDGGSNISYPTTIGNNFSSGEFSICLWIKHNYSIIPANTIWFKGGSWAEGGLSLNSNSKIQLSQINKPTISSTNIINPNTWTFIIFTYSSNLLKIYINGALDSTNTYPGFNWSTVVNTPAAGIGIRTGNTFLGDIDDFKIYNISLNQSQINYLYNN